LTGITGISHEDLGTYIIISRSIAPRITNFAEKILEKIETRIICSVGLNS